MNLKEYNKLWDNLLEDKETGCWNWQRAKTPAGYGEIWIEGKLHFVHRVMYALQIAEDFTKVKDFSGVIHHECNNPSCCNPEHLVWFESNATHISETTQGRKYNITRTHCKNGHKWTEENTYHRPDGKRDCKTCLRNNDRRHKAKKKS